MSLTLPVAPTIPKTRDPNFPHLLFEFHEHTGKVYAVEIPGSWEGGAFTAAVGGKATAHVIAEHCDTHGRFIGFVQTYLRGMKRGMVEANLR